MKYQTWIATLGAIAFVAAAMPAYAQAPAAAQWTKDDVNTFCNNRTSGKPKPYQKCVTNNQKRVGKKKTAADVQMIQTGKRPPKKTAPATAQ